MWSVLETPSDILILHNLKSNINVSVIFLFILSKFELTQDILPMALGIGVGNRPESPGGKMKNKPN